VLFANGALDACAHISIPGFPDGAITARVWDSPQAYSWTGKQMRHGIDIPVTADAEVIELRDVGRR
jgi:hypothetical protein